MRRIIFYCCKQKRICGAIGRYECNIIGTISQEPVGDRDGHVVTSFKYSCYGVDGLLKGAVATTVVVIEWDGPRGTFLGSVKFHRAPGGLAISQNVEGTASAIVKEGRPAGREASGTGLIKFASGALARLSGKSVKGIQSLSDQVCSSRSTPTDRLQACPLRAQDMTLQLRAYFPTNIDLGSLRQKC